MAPSHVKPMPRLWIRRRQGGKVQQMSAIYRSWLAGLLMWCMTPGFAFGEMRALLVGVSSYPTLEKSYELHGPKNDVQRMRQVLQQRGFAADSIQVLADGVSGAQEPTRRNILQALEAQARAARPGDMVFLYFAGHGSQQPADRNTPEGRQEPDGRFEIFLPIDVGRWDGKVGNVSNAIADFELRAAVDKIQDRGAFVWAVFDACHSASLVRGAVDDDIRYRHVSPEDLGISAKSLDAATARAKQSAKPAPRGEISSAGTASTGKAVYFYAAQTTELTPEMRLPLGDEHRRPYGLFSFTLSRALEMAQPMTYRQLAQYVLTQYGGMIEARVTPLFSGTALDQAVLDQQVLPVRQWPLTLTESNTSVPTATVPTGSLSGLVEGAVFAVVPSPIAKTEEAVAYLRARRVEMNQTELEPVAHGGVAAVKARDLKAGAYARLIGSPENYALRVSVDASECRTTCPWESLLQRLRQDGVPGLDMQWVKSGGDIALKLETDRLAALAPSEQGRISCRGASCGGPRPGATLYMLPQSARLSLSDATAQVAHSLHAIGRARNLMRLAGRLAAQSNDSGLVATIEYAPKGKQTRQPIAPESVPALRAGDRLIVTIENKGHKPVDVTLLYADARYGISSLFPGSGEINRFEPGARLTIDDIQISDKDAIAGIERLFVISVQAEPHAERADLSFLAQPPLRVAEERVRGGAIADDIQAFLDAGFADYRTRAAVKLPGSRTGMQVFTFDVKLDPVKR